MNQVSPSRDRSLAVHDVRSVFDAGQHSRQQVGRILQVGIEDEHQFAATDRQPRSQCPFLPEVAGEVDGNDCRIGLRELLHLLAGSVG